MNPEILIAMGSPRKNGNTATLAAKLSEGAQAAGATVETLYLNGMNTRPCQSCYKCKEADADNCVLDDDMRQVYPLLREAKALVIASPVYWFNMSAQTRLFIDRLLPVGTGPHKVLDKKHFGLLMSFGGADAVDSGAINALRSFQDMCSYLGASIAGVAYGTATEAGEIKENEQLMARVYALGKKMAVLPVQES
jgi:multimeric flavodoxin WrbA